MTEIVTPYQITAAPEPKIELTHSWQRRLFKKANHLHDLGRPCALTVVFASDGCVTFYPADADGRVCP